MENEQTEIEKAIINELEFIIEQARSVYPEYIIDLIKDRIDLYKNGPGI